VTHGADVDFGFAAAGNAVQQDRRIGVAVNLLFDLFED
jgi:hypothetical protein